MRSCAIRTIFATLIAVVAASLVPCAPVARGQEEIIDREYEIKAAFLYNFGRYTEWPEGSKAADEDFVIGVLGKDPFKGFLTRIAKRKKIRGRRIVVRHFRSATEYEPCEILFVAKTGAGDDEKKTASERLRAAVEATKGSPTLLVADGQGLARAGAAIAFFIEENRAKFEINPEAAKRRKLEISSRLLRLSKIVDDHEQPP